MQLEAGFGKVQITPILRDDGPKLVGYGGRDAPANAIHDDIWARAMVLSAGGVQLAICALELCYIENATIAAMREAIAARTSIPAANIFISTVHTHAGPRAEDAANWSKPLAEIVADAVQQAAESAWPVRIGTGFGVLPGCGLNRRWPERPVDPALGVIRIDEEKGNPLGVLVNFGVHGVVMGSNNLAISGDWPGFAARRMEERLGAICLVNIGGSANVNPLTVQDRARLQSGTPFTSRPSPLIYHGDAGSDPREHVDFWNTFNRNDGTWHDVAALGGEVADEAWRVWRGARVSDSVDKLWVASARVDVRKRPDAPEFDVLWPAQSQNPLIEDSEQDPLEVMAVGIEGPGVLLLGQPGEVFAESAVKVRAEMQRNGYAVPMSVSYANGWNGYLPPLDAFIEGGYEPQWPVMRGIDPRVQEFLQAALHHLVKANRA
jgi:hypothetical protein